MLPRSRMVVLVLLLAVAVPSFARAQTANAGTPVVATHSGDEVHPTLIRDGRGGAFVGFQVLNSIHVARLLQNGTPNPSWTPSVASAAGGGPSTLIASAGTNRVWAVSYTQSAGQHFMQQLVSGGPATPAVVATRSPDLGASEMTVVAQPGGGVMSVHVDPGQADYLLSEHVDAAGGVTQSAVFLDYALIAFCEIGDAVPDGTGGAIASVKTYDGTDTRYNLHAIKLKSDGTPAWAIVSRNICTAALDQLLPVGATDGAGGAFFAWPDSRNSDVYITRILTDGSTAPGWTANGKSLAAVTGVQTEPSLVADGSGGVWAVWTDPRSGVSKLYFTHLNSAGTPLAGFGATGRALTTLPSSEFHARTCPDGAGGLFVVWLDGRNGSVSDLYAQHILTNGNVAAGMPPDGVAICTNAAEEQEPVVLDVATNSAIVAWHDNRSGGAIVYAAPVPSSGAPGVNVAPGAAGGLALAPLGANPAHGAAEWIVSAPDRGPVSARLIDAAGRVRAVRSLEPQAAGTRVHFDLPEPGLYFLVASQSGNTRVSRVVAVR